MIDDLVFVIRAGKPMIPRRPMKPECQRKYEELFNTLLKVVEINCSSKTDAFQHIAKSNVMLCIKTNHNVESFNLNINSTPNIQTQNTRF